MQTANLQRNEIAAPSILSRYADRSNGWLDVHGGGMTGRMLYRVPFAVRERMVLDRAPRWRGEGGTNHVGVI